MQNTIRMTVEVLDFKEGSFTPEGGGSAIQFSNALVRFGNRELKLKTDVKLNKQVGSEVEVEVSITPGAGQKPVLTIVSVE